ncbi:hypothetical protein F5Y04DRAFT_1967 [Hypomontagnella monticulosa]|nr:hypothetical protein F5Y04DRAFT_1967 [Hypomontagnella monticulosa]
MSSFGSPGAGPYAGKPVPPQRGSFPLDHDGECKNVMTKYLSCIKKVKGVNDEECRNLAKSYLACRMDRTELRISGTVVQRQWACNLSLLILSILYV